MYDKEGGGECVVLIRRMDKVCDIVDRVTYWCVIIINPT